MLTSLTTSSRTDPGTEASTSSASSYSNPYTDPIPQSPPPSRLVYPTYPDVSLKKLPFFRLGKSSKHDLHLKVGMPTIRIVKCY